jgi:hypothetical protein
MDTLRANYPTARREELVHMFPSRSWSAISDKANKAGVHRAVTSDTLSIPIDMSLTDVRMVKEFALQPGTRVQWKHEEVTNGDYKS